MDKSNNNKRSGKNGSTNQNASGSNATKLNCTVCGENMTNSWFQHLCNLPTNEPRPSPPSTLRLRNAHSLSVNQDQWNKSVHFADLRDQLVQTVQIPIRIVAGNQGSGSCQGSCCRCDCDCIQCQFGKSPQQNESSNARLSQNQRNVDFESFDPPINSTPRCSQDYANTPPSGYYDQSTAMASQYGQSNGAYQERPSTSMSHSGRRPSYCDRSSITQDTVRNLTNTELNNTLFHPGGGPSGSQSSTKDKESLLYEDTYNPGLIEDCVEGIKDFNVVSFGMFFENIQHIPKELPDSTPMTLIEAFHKRIDSERAHMADALHCNETKHEINVDTIKLYFSYKPKTELNSALANLFTAEALYVENKAHQKATDVPVDEAPYDMDIRKTELPLVGGCPITVEAFIGTTKPRKSDPKKGDSKSGKKK